LFVLPFAESQILRLNNAASAGSNSSSPCPQQRSYAAALTALAFKNTVECFTAPGMGSNQWKTYQTRQPSRPDIGCFPGDIVR